MEIDKAIKESSDRRLQTKYSNATYVIERAFALYEFDQVAFSFNGGKDSTVLLHLLRAGYYLHKEKVKTSNGNQLDCPIRTIYFETPSAFPEINLFTYQTAAAYDLRLEIIRLDFKSGLETLMKEKPTKAIFLGTRIGDPNAVGQEQFSPSSPGWPPFMRVNPILDWSYRDVWAFLLTCKVQYCSLYDKGYTSIGSIYDTVPNALLSISDMSNKEENFKPAYMLSDGRLERAGRTKKSILKCESADVLSNGLNNVDLHQRSSLSASIVAVGDEILCGTTRDTLGPMLCKKLHDIGWLVAHIAIVRNEIDSVAEEIERRKSTDDIIFLFGGVGPLHSDVSVAGVAKAFGVRLVLSGDVLRRVNIEREWLCRHGSRMVMSTWSENGYIHNLPNPDSGTKGSDNFPEGWEELKPQNGGRSLILVCLTHARRAPDEEFEEHLRHLIGDQCTGDRNEMALLPEGITELLHHEKLLVPLIKCHNVIVLSAVNISEMEKQWDCLLELPGTPVVRMEPFASKHLSTTLSDVETAENISKLCFDYPDIYINCYRKSRVGPLVISFIGKDQTRVESAAQELSQRFPLGAFSEVNSR